LAYRDDHWYTDFANGAMRAIRQTFRFSGRSSRTELVGYYLISMIAVGFLRFGISFFVTAEVRNHIDLALQCLIFLPFPALLVRRLNDQSRTGKFALLLALPALYAASGSLASLLGGIEGRIAFDQSSYLLFWPAQLCAIAVLVFYLWPGTSGPNRFGEDPRGQQAIMPQD
jgi:uncharacterized membrane protein YhaH (DUF805 family)